MPWVKQESIPPKSGALKLTELLSAMRTRAGSKRPSPEAAGNTAMFTRLVPSNIAVLEEIIPLFTNRIF
jgi:hypothetical protein